jgi:dCTP diphosphatase
MNDLDGLRMKLRDFAAARDWDQFHSPKNLAMALSAEAGELLEVFQWLTEDGSKRLDAKAKSAAADEIADVLLYLVRLADKLGLDPVVEAQRKLTENEQRYPADKARGSAKKSTEL